MARSASRQARDGGGGGPWEGPGGVRGGRNQSLVLKSLLEGEVFFFPFLSKDVTREVKDSRESSGLFFFL